MAHVRRWYLLALLALWDVAGLCRDGVSHVAELRPDHANPHT